MATSIGQTFVETAGRTASGFLLTSWTLSTVKASGIMSPLKIKWLARPVDWSLACAAWGRPVSSTAHGPAPETQPDGRLTKQERNKDHVKH